MAKLSIAKIKPAPQLILRRENSHARLYARRAGLHIPDPDPALPKAEQEASDIN